VNSPFYEKLNSRVEYGPRAHIRLIDWQRRSVGRASPHAFTEADLEGIVGSEMLLARKSDESEDRAIIDRVSEAVCERQRRPRPDSAAGGK
jgi:hypothetical protein